MKSILKLAALVAVSCSFVAAAHAGYFQISETAPGSGSFYDSANVSVPSGAYWTYYENIQGSGSTEVVVQGAGASEDDTQSTAGVTYEGASFPSSGNVFISVYAASSGGSGASATATVSLGW